MRMASARGMRERHRPSVQCLLQRVHTVGISRLPKHKNSSKCTAISLRQQQQQLTVQLTEALQQHQQQSDQIVATAALVDQAVAAVLASPDWQQLQQSFQHAALQYNAAATCMPAAAALQQSCNSQSTQTPASSSSSSVSRSSIRVSSAAAGGSSPWGFALRQPKQAQQAQASQPRAAQGSNTTAAAAALEKQRQQWDWAAVQELAVLGIGSMGKLRPCSTAQAQEGSQRSSRLGFRFFQLAVAKALQASLLTGLTKPGSVFDPDFDEFDRQLLAALGFEVLAAEPAYPVAEGSSKLVYMPCCPRDLYSTILAANNGRLQQLAVFGTSMRSLADSEALFEALTTTAVQQTGVVTNQAKNVTAALTAADQKSTDVSSSSSSSSSRTGSDASHNSSRFEAGSNATGTGAAAAAAAANFVEQAYQQGGVIEVPCPDCAAHGVGVAVHLFGKQAVQV